MATLAQKTTDGSDSFTKYVTKNPRFKETLYQIENKQDGPLLAKKGNSMQQIAVLKEGDKFNIIDSNHHTIANVRYAKVKYQSKEGYIALTKIRKPTAGNGTAYEDEVVDALNIMFKQFGAPVAIKIGRSLFKDMTYAVKVDTQLKRAGGARGDPKADIIICKDKKNPLGEGSIYISHKKEGGPEAFQQYGGLTEAAGSDIYSHPEVQKFLKEASSYVAHGKLTNPLMKDIKDKKLINMSIYGPDYGKKFSLQHVQLIGQGKPKLTKIKEDQYALDFTSHMSISGDLSHFTGGYLPVFGATYREGRGFTIGGKRVDGARVGIYPAKLIQSRSGLVEL
jgi:hypothetical protein